MGKTILFFISVLILVPVTAYSSSIYTQTPQGDYSNNVLYGSGWRVFMPMMTDSHSIEQGDDFADLSLLLNFDAVWVDQELNNSLSSSEISSLQSYISSGHKAVLIGENSSWSSWNQSIIDVVGGSHQDTVSTAVGSPISDNPLTDGVNRVQNVYGSIILDSTGDPDILFSNNFAAVYSVGLGEALVILDSNWLDHRFIYGYDNAVFAENIVTWLGETIEPVPEPATMLLLGSGLAGIAGLRKRMKKK